MEKFIQKFGGYKKLWSYQKSVIVFDATVYFCKRFVSKRDRTYDQMIQAARSGKQNIVEGSMASVTSKSTEIKLTGVALASLEELLEDYRDFARKNKIEEWPDGHSYSNRLKELCRLPDATYETFQKGIENPDPAICVNVIIGLIKVTNKLLNKQIARLEKDFVKLGGIRERMYKARFNERKKQGQQGQQGQHGR